MRQSLYIIAEIINTLFPVVNFIKCVVTEVVVFLWLLLRWWHFTSQCSDTLEVWCDL